MGTAELLRRNAIIRQLPDEEFERLRERADIVDAEIRQQVFEPGEPITHVYFPLGCVYSMVAVADDRVVIEVATTGPEGMAGLPLFLGAATSPHSAFCQIPGQAARLDADSLRALLSDDGTLHALLNRLTQATMVQVAQNVVCNGTHDVEQRSARWLLTTHDRVDNDTFPITQQFLAQMLGSRRQTVSQIARRLQDRGLVTYARGVMHVEDRLGLEALACQCYWIVRREFDALIG
ncbi:MAG TPA: Crp/Fnr family transcriptional regulator [Nocardioides sp.]|uniref:Crp/Fnr family transcriptional regulator n=1 Tax=Nocardioides sp. TaxID=35761 RepID=UPI002F40CCE3